MLIKKIIKNILIASIFTVSSVIILVIWGIVDLEILFKSFFVGGIVATVLLFVFFIKILKNKQGS